LDISKSVASSPAPVSKKLNISDTAFDFIVEQEDSTEAYYTRHYTHFDWPEGASGPTIGIGYDCGYVTRLEAAMDWQNIVDDKTLQVIQSACGKRGYDADMWVAKNRDSVTISWDVALREFKEREVPKWISRVNLAVPNCSDLSPDSFGALVSLCYNRGTGGFKDPSPRFSEMREIRHLMTTKEFAKISAEIRSMGRLWKQNSGLGKRRVLEAKLFEKGLA
jgi:hypothetical protein